MTSTPTSSTYPNLRPTGRRFDPGNFPIRTYNSQNGTEIRFLYGNKRFNLKLQLTYANISDEDAELFLEHFDDMYGTYNTFTVSASNRVNVYAGWAGENNNALTPPTGVSWRYEQAPQVVSVRPGVSTVNVALIGVI